MALLTTLPGRELKDGAISDPLDLDSRVTVVDIFPGQQLTAGHFERVFLRVINGRNWSVRKPRARGRNGSADRLILRTVGQVVLLWTTAALARLHAARIVVPGAQQF